MHGLIENLIIMVFSLLLLLISSDIAIKYIVKMSELTGLGKSRIGFTFVAATTTLPELMVAIFSGISGEAAISVGNVLGSNVANVCLVIGLGLILYNFKKSRKASVPVKLKSDELDVLYFGIFTASIIPILLISFVPASRIVGLILIIIYVYQSYKIISKKEIVLDKLSDENVVKRNIQGKKVLINSLILSLLGIIGVIISARLIVDSTVEISNLIGVPSFLISAIVIAVGTSFPEITLGIRAMLEEHGELTIGNIIGSCFTNITLILGVTLAFSPVALNIRGFTDIIAFSLLANILLWYFLHRGRLGWKEGFYLVLLYSLFLASIMGLLVFPE
ncbi:MAG: sodium:calcium antiporter [Thermoproteota archaeon]|nr:sodium:calcium antiporter [Candidatus Brockarchaeota archaeon]